MITETVFGSISNGRTAHKITLKNHSGMTVVCSDIGATITELWVPDKNGEFKDIVLGYQTALDYETKDLNFGATIGRSANRIANGVFSLNGKEYHLPKNEGNNNLHSGPNGYQTLLWDYRVSEREQDIAVTFFGLREAGEHGYPGNLSVAITYRLTEANALCISFSGESDADTIFNLTNHSYFNLNGHDSGTILSHRLKIFGDTYTPINAERLPVGTRESVIGTPFDFTVEKPIGRDMDLSDSQLIYGPGYDHNFFVNGNCVKNQPSCIASLTGDLSGIRMDLSSPLPCLQFYNGCQTEFNGGKANANYTRYTGICLEPQFMPNAINLRDISPSPVLPAKTKREYEFIYRFTKAE